jgi:hypothetical protein
MVGLGSGSLRAMLNYFRVLDVCLTSSGSDAVMTRLSPTGLTASLEERGQRLKRGRWALRLESGVC